MCSCDKQWRSQRFLVPSLSSTGGPRGTALGTSRRWNPPCAELTLALLATSLSIQCGLLPDPHLGCSPCGPGTLRREIHLGTPRPRHHRLPARQWSPGHSHFIDFSFKYWWLCLYTGLPHGSVVKNALPVPETQKTWV